MTLAFDGCNCTSPLETSISTVESLFLLRCAAAVAGGFDAGAAIVSGALLSLVLPESSEGNRPRICAAASASFRAASSASAAAVAAIESFLAFFCSLSFMPLLAIGCSSSASIGCCCNCSSTGGASLCVGTLSGGHHGYSNGFPAASASALAAL